MVRIAVCNAKNTKYGNPHKSLGTVRSLSFQFAYNNKYKEQIDETFQ